ncbi:hypothetical protein [Vreelandella sulfidaeris]|uniref:hypothetical protein n=1 Tax=Vreelandella sulfidaeris TaxID=115553 RepID=UPI0035EBF958
MIYTIAILLSLVGYFVIGHLAGGVGYWVVRPRHQKAAAARTAMAMAMADTH